MNSIPSQVNSKIDQVLQKSDSLLKPVLDNKFALAAITLVLAVNVVNTFNLESIVGTDLINSNLPQVVKPFLYNKVVKYVSLFLVVLFLTKDIKKAVLITLIAFIVMRIFFNENFDNITTDVYPGCVNVTVADLLALFDGNETELRKSMYKLSIPLNLTLTDANAPKIASYFVTHGKKITDSCTQPM